MPSLNTLKSTARYLLTLPRRYLPARSAGGRLEEICNFVRIDARLATAGQPTAAQLGLVQQSGFRTVINLAPHDSANALPDETTVAARLGLRYVYVPVDFKAPSERDFERFCQALQESGDAPVLVHCAANMRASAFVYRYRWQVLGEPRQAAAAALHRVWKPAGIWQAFSEGRG